MKLKRLIAITVAMATLLSCSCFAGINVSAASEPVKTFRLFDGQLYSFDKSTALTAGDLFSYTTTKKYTVNGVEETDTTKYPQGILDSNHNANSKIFTFGTTGLGSGTLATMEYASGAVKPASDTNNMYYAISYYLFRNSVKPGTFSLVAGGTNSIADNVLSFKSEVYIPAETKAAPRTISQKMDAGQLHSAANGMAINYTYNETSGKGYVTGDPTVSGMFDNGWTKAVEMDADKWYTWEIRWHYDVDTDKLQVATYLDNTQVSYYYADVSDKQSGGTWTSTTTNALAFSTNDARLELFIGTASSTDDDTYFDEISLRLLDNTNFPTVWTGDPERIELNATAASGSVTATANIYGNNNVANPCLIIALWKNDGTFVIKTSSTPSTVGDCRTLTCELSAANGKNYKAFLFDGLTSAIPLVANASGTIN